MNAGGPPAPPLRELKARAQRLKPLVHVGRGGLSAALVATVERALDDHGLVKVKFDTQKEEKATLAAELVTRTGGLLVQQVGHVVVIYRQPQGQALKPGGKAPGIAPGA